MTHASFEVTHIPKVLMLSERAIGCLMLTVIAVTQVAWFVFLGYAAWKILFG